MEFIAGLIQNEVAFAWVLIRVAAFVSAIPLMGGLGVPTKIKVLMTFAVALVLFPMIPVPPQPTETGTLLAGIFGEVLVGWVIGMGFRLLFAAVDLAAEIEGLQMGFGIGNVFNPTLGQEVSLIGQLRGLAVLLLFLAMNAHHILFEALVGSFHRVPPLSVTLSISLYEQMIRLSGEMFALGVKIAVPVTLVLILTNLAFGILARVVPQMNIILFSFPVATAVGLLVLGTSFSFFASLMHDRIDGLGGVSFDLLEGMRKL
jgi:flagellar biosynthetic protein FliR